MSIILNTRHMSLSPSYVPSFPIIWLHGYGGCSESMKTTAAQVPCGFSVCLDAQDICEDYSEGRQWFSLKPMPWAVTSIEQAWQPIAPLIAQAARDTYTRIRHIVTEGPFWLGGFSQGAMLAYEIAFNHPGVVGVLGFSGAHYISHPPVYTPKLFWAHCQDDTVVPAAWMQQTQTLWNQFGLHSESCLTQHGGHTITSQQLERAREFISQNA